ncbi:TetR/AcrR family transcriptional regulator, partial [Bradyrhizobium sp. CSA207]|nr:TetR/AcrR family transcriptional regulator [Bradyrhizobium sp. CSA207]
PAMARAAKEAAKVLLRSAGVDVGDAVKPAVKRGKRAPH